MSARYIAYCTPSLGMVSIWWSRCVQSVLHPNNHGKAIFYLRDKEGGEIAEVRNGIVDAVLRYDKESAPVSHLFWIDDDVLVFPGCLLELLHQNVPICSGVYFTKLPDRLSSPLIYPEAFGGTARFVPDAAMDVWAHGMGLTLVKTEVYKRMRDELDLGLDKYNRTKWYHTSNMMEDVKQDERTGAIYTGCTEDTYFMTSAARLGYRGRVVTTKHAFGFHYDAQKDIGYPTEQWKQWVAGNPIRWNAGYTGLEQDVVWD